MGVIIFISGTSADKEIKGRQQTLLQILQTKQIHYRVIDITLEENEEKRDFMQKSATFLGATALEPNPSHPLPPQIFNEDDYCGDYEQFEMANENKELDTFLKLGPEEPATYTSAIKVELNQEV